MKIVDPTELSTGDLVVEINEWTTLIRSPGWARFLELCKGEEEKCDTALDVALISLDAVPGQEFIKGMRKASRAMPVWVTARLELLNEQLDYIKENEDERSEADAAD